MGFLNLETRLRATGFATPDHIHNGPVTFVSHSGSAFAAFAFNDRRIGFNLFVSSGQELVTDVSEYMEYALGLSSTRVIALLIETIRRPDAFRTALTHASYRDVPVIALKVGRTERSKSMVTAHSGALAGEDGAFEALFDTHGVLRVSTLDDMADAMELFSCPRRVTTGSGIASIHDSGGERALFVDVAADLRVPFARISEVTTARIQAALDPGLEAANPLDAWGTGIDADRIFLECFRALHDDPDTAALAFVVDMAQQGEPHDEGYLHIAREVFASTTKPFCVLSNLASAIANDEAALLRDDGIPVLEGTASGLVALRHLLGYRDARRRPPLVPPEPVSDVVRERWRARLAPGEEVGELEGLALLADYDISTTQARAATSVDRAIAAAEEVGWPIALKTAAPGVQHKSDVGGVVLGLSDADELRAAYEDVASRLGPHVIVAAMAPPGVELALGIVRDPQFGPLVLVAAGGVLVEILHDRRLGLPPLDEPHARVLIDRLRFRSVLDGVRGAPPADVDALTYTISRLSLLAADLGDLLEAIDVNPMIVSPQGCVAVDVLVIPRRP
jgi:acyl-CoA synthetase (NDP forming)